MRLARRRERLLDAYVELASAAEREPRAASGAERLRLLDLREAEQLPEETTRLGLAARRCRELNVV